MTGHSPTRSHSRCELVSPAGGAGTEPAWRSKPSWYLQVGDDTCPTQRFIAKRPSATVVEVPGSNAIYVSDPKVVANLIE